jgi:hypothetical protein
MNAEAKRQAIAAYKKRKLSMGIYAVRCQTSGEIWVGQSRNLDTLQNRFWFALRLGNHHNRALQVAFTQYGRDAFTFEPLQQLPDEATAYPESILSDLAEDWRDELGAYAV